MVDISEKVVLSYKKASSVVIPDTLVHVSEDGTKYLKVQGSHPTIVKLVAADQVDLLRSCRNPSLSHGEYFALLKQKQQEALEALCSKEEEKDAEALFEAKEKNKTSKKKLALKDLPETLGIELAGQTIVLLRPSTWKGTDVWVQMDANMLAATFDFLSKDCEECFKDGTKRSYNKRKLE